MLLTFYLPIVLAALVAIAFALATKDRWTAFWRGLLTPLLLLTAFQFIKSMIDAANNPDARESDFVGAGLGGLFLGLLLGGIVGIGVGSLAKSMVEQKRKF